MPVPALYVVTYLSCHDKAPEKLVVNSIAIAHRKTT